MNFISLIKQKKFLLIGLLFFIIAFVVYYLTGEGGATPYHYFVPLADAFLDGRLYLLEKPPWLNEILLLNGKFYVIYPPMPALLLIPQVAISGLEANQTLASVFWGSINVIIIFFLIRRLTNKISLQIWLTLLFGFGTIHWYLASIGKAWFFAHIASVFFLLLAIYETYGKRRPLLIGLLVGASYWCRLPVILSLPFFIVMLSDQWLNPGKSISLIKRIDLMPVLKLCIGAGIFVLLNFLYNYLRYETPFDVAYEIQSANESWFYPKGLFHYSYILKHLWIFFLKPPVIISDPPYIVPGMMGLSVLFTTPAFIYSVFAGIRRTTLACISAIVPIALVAFLHGGVGWIQFGYRFAVDFYPFLFLLTVLGIKSTLSNEDKLRWDHKILIVFSIAVNLWGVLWINKFGWFSLWD